MSELRDGYDGYDDVVEAREAEAWMEAHRPCRHEDKWRGPDGGLRCRDCGKVVGS